MKSPTSQQSRILRQIQNTNKEIMKNTELKHSALTRIQTILGIEHTVRQKFGNDISFSPTSPNAPKPLSLLSLNDEQILYYSCKYFVIYNMGTKQYQIINKDIKNCVLVQMKKFNTAQNQKKLIVCIYQTQNTFESTFLGLLTIKTDYESRTSRNDSRYEWKAIRLHGHFNSGQNNINSGSINSNNIQQTLKIEDFCFYPKKNLLYFITTKLPSIEKQTIFEKSSFNESLTSTSDKCPQFLWIYDLTKEIMLINQEIRSNTVGFYVHYLSLEDSNVIYLVGKNYFRQWTVNFNEKSVKESNVRNVERVVKNKKLVDFQEIEKYSLRQDIDHPLLSSLTSSLPTTQQSQSPTLNPHLQHNNFQILTQPSKLLIILTTTELIIVKNNELICALSPQQNLSKKSRSKDNIEKELENSFNQIHKMKFLFDQYEELKENEERKRRDNASKGVLDGVNERMETECNQGASFSCISRAWKAQNQNHYFAIANTNKQVLIYELCDYQVKLYTQFPCSNSSTLISIIPTQAGDLLLCLNQNNEVHLINQENYDPEDDLPVKSLWGNGQMHSGKIFAISSPMIQNIMCTVGEDGTFKLWAMRKNERSIMFESRPSCKPLGITIHPGGTMIGVNFEREIKLFSILPKQFYEITSIKTNYCSIQLRYSERGEFLVSNEGSVLIFYEPFSLKTLGYIEPADLKCRITDFKLSKSSNYVCFLAEDNSCYLQPVEVGQLSKWEHFSAAHRQVEPYTAFHFDFIEKDKISTDDKKTRSLFVGATKSKYMVFYEEIGTKLLAEFPIVDCYIVDIEVHENLMFAATSKGTLRIYNWPILQEDLQLQVYNLDHNQIRYKPPRYEQYPIWHESIPISKIHKLHFSNELIISNDRGNICVMSFQQTKNKKIIYEEVSGERKKMQQLINQMFYIKKSEAEKRNKLIQKTENDILKVENEILREKISLQRKMDDEETFVAKGYEMKSVMQDQEKLEYLEKEQQEIHVLKQQIDTKNSKLQELKSFIVQDYESKKMYEQSRNQNVSQEIKEIVLRHKEKIRRKIETHKEDIRNKKKEYFCKVKNVQDEFEKEVLAIYEQKVKQFGESEERLRVLQEKKLLADKSDKKMSLLKAKSKSTQLLANILNQNALSNENTLQTDNQNVKKLLNKLQTIENSHHHSTSLLPNQSNPQLLHNTASYTNINIPTQTHSTLQNSFTSKPPIKDSLTTSTKLKRSGMYQISEKNFLRKREKEQLEQRQKQLQAKIQNRNKLMEEEFNNQILQELTSQQNSDILIQSCRVEQLQQSNQQLEKIIQQLKQRVENMENQDQSLQKEFQKNLEEYNLARFQNLNLHCEVLKMQNQLIERKQVLDNKEEIVMLAYQEKEKLQNYKELVKGSLSKLQQKKETMRDVFFRKQNDLNSIFTQLVNEIHKMEQKKSTLQKLERKINENSKQLFSKDTQVNEVISKLKDIKKYLLLERMTEQKSQKSIFQYEESLIQTINFLKKRLFMESIKEKKNKQLKKSSLNQILKQNKNLLEECNQLRSEGIEYENEIRNLSNKLKEANKMISIETKLKSQKNEVHEQKNQLDIIKQLFSMHLKQFQENKEEGEERGRVEEENEDENQGQNNGRQVYFDSTKPVKQFKKNKSNKVIFNNLTNAFSVDSISDKSHTEYKPFKLSKYIEAEPFEKIQI